MKKEELKPCPFCGGRVTMKEVVVYNNGEKSPAVITCKKCNYHIANLDDDELIKLWNTRPSEKNREMKFMKCEFVKDTWGFYILPLLGYSNVSGDKSFWLGWLFWLVVLKLK